MLKIPFSDGLLNRMKIQWYIRVVSLSKRRQRRTMPKDSQHVVPHPNGGWAVKKGGARRATKRFSTKHAAITYGRRISRVRVQSCMYTAETAWSAVWTLT